MEASFRGRIFRAEEGYEPRSLLELRLRASIGAILNKREWWIKWQRNSATHSSNSSGADDHGATDASRDVRTKWLAELEENVVRQTVVTSTSEWFYNEPFEKFDAFPTEGTDDEKRGFIEMQCRTIEYNLIWNEHWLEEEEYTASVESETPEDYMAANARMESYGQVVWYLELVGINRRMKQVPVNEWVGLRSISLASPEAMEEATKLLLLARKGDVTRQTFAEWCPDGDHRPLVLDALWVHIDRIMAELDGIRKCVTQTLDKIISNHRLDVEPVTGFVSPGPLQETWMSDLLISAAQKAKFVDEVAKLGDVPEMEKDWHPGSNQQVLDLLHPSLYCCVFGTTRKVPASMQPIEGEDPAEHMQRIIFRASEVVENEFRGTANYQWIPSDFKVHDNGQVSILSYINNLHPVKQSEMYDSIASIFARFVPMFNRVLVCLSNSDGPEPFLEIPDLYEREIHEIPQHPPVPEILRLHPPGTPFTLRNKIVQVIVKIAEIHLTPEMPSYPGGSWHVEGSDAEQIVATGICYFGCENITESRLSFRVIVQEPEYQQSDAVGMRAMFGLEGDERLVQHLGSVTALEDRCIVFPNTLQHRVEPFELADPLKPGVRKILAFFIVNPSRTIPSTATIPPQQESWVADAQTPILSQLQALPETVLETTLRDLLGRGMSLPAARIHRSMLMGERMPGADEEDDYELFFSLCEH